MEVQSLFCRELLYKFLKLPGGESLLVDIHKRGPMRAITWLKKEWDTSLLQLLLKNLVSLPWYPLQPNVHGTRLQDSMWSKLLEQIKGTQVHEFLQQCDQWKNAANKSNKPSAKRNFAISDRLFWHDDDLTVKTAHERSDGNCDKELAHVEFDLTGSKTPPIANKCSANSSLCINDSSDDNSSSWDFNFSRASSSSSTASDANASTINVSEDDSR